MNQKTVGSLQLGDVIYIPYVNEIRESRICGLKDVGSGLINIMAQISEASTDSDRSFPKKAQTTYVGRYGHVVCVNRDKAVRIQHEMRLKLFQDRADEIQQKTESLIATVKEWFKPLSPESKQVDTEGQP